MIKRLVAGLRWRLLLVLLACAPLAGLTVSILVKDYQDKRKRRQ